MNIISFPILTLFLSALFLCGGCGAKYSQETVDRVRSEVAQILKKESAEIDVTKPLVGQGADDLNIVEIVMAVEKAFDIEIPDSEIGQNFAEISKGLTVQRLAEIASKQHKRRTK